jgi:hypothetical protein
MVLDNTTPWSGLTKLTPFLQSLDCAERLSGILQLEARHLGEGCSAVESLAGREVSGGPELNGSYVVEKTLTRLYMKSSR